MYRSVMKFGPNLLPALKVNTKEGGEQTSVDSLRYSKFSCCFYCN